MARIRTIKPEFWQNESLADLEPMTRLLAIGLLNHADDEGYFKASPALIRAAVFPYDDSANILGMLQELSGAGYLALSTGEDGRQYGWIINFLKHQRVDKPKKSEIKGLCSFQESSKNIPRIILDNSKQEGKGKEEEMEGKGVGADAPPPPPKKPKGKKITLAEYIEQQTLAKEKLIPESHAVLKYAEQAGIPENFLHLAWQKFKARYTSGDSAQKKYIDWPAVFDNAVRDNWMKVWFIEGGIYKLTTAGQQAELARKSHVAH